jgi:hypothetical protein
MSKRQPIIWDADPHTITKIETHEGERRKAGSFPEVKVRALHFGQFGVSFHQDLLNF